MIIIDLTWENFKLLCETHALEKFYVEKEKEIEILAFGNGQMVLRFILDKTGLTEDELSDIKINYLDESVECIKFSKKP